ncbi:MAG: hypothetical protein ACOZB3_08510 [Calditrichota bacterium]
MTAKKTKGSHPAPKAAATSSAAKPGLKIWQQDLIACVAIFLAVFVLFHQIPLEGKSFSRGDDTESAASMSKFAEDAAKSGEFPMWNPYVFGGFPGLAAGAYFNYEHIGLPFSLAYKYLSPRYWADIFSIHGLFWGFGNDQSNGGRWQLSLFLYGGLLIYLLMRRLSFNPMISGLAGLLMAWNPYLISLATAAHGGKLMTFIYMPFIILCAWNVMEKRRLFDLALLALAFGWQIAVGGHTQILFYSFVTVGLIYIVWAILEFRQNATVRILIPAGLIAVALILGFTVGSLWYIPLLEYVGFSIRGMGPAIATAGGQAGYSMADATMWSFAPKELITFIVPSWYGLQSPYYWGDMPFTSSSFYFGAVPLLFAVLAFWGKKDRLFWGLVAVTVFSILLSFGRHFEIFYGIFFNILPFFNKFRTPSLILLLVVLSGIIFSAYGLRFVLGLDNNEKWRKISLYGMIASAILLVIVLIAGDALSGLFGSFTKAGETGRYTAAQMQQLQAMRFDMLHTDLLLALLWLALAFGACWLKITGKLNSTVFLAVILIITVIDLGRFSTKFFDPQPASSVLDTLKPNRLVDALRQDQTTFRVMPLGRLMQDNRWAAWKIASLGGYHGAKMRSYQDLVDNVFFNGPDRRLPLNLPFFSAMNCKYFVVESPLPEYLEMELVAQDPASKQLLYRNPRVLNRVYFVDSLHVISDRTETLRRIMQPNFLFDYEAVIDQPLPGPIAPHYQRTASVTEYTPDRVRIAANTPTPSFMIFSDAYYAPGWEATDNGLPTTIYKVNGFVRGLYLKPGEHTIEFRYTGKYEKMGETVATLSHFVVWGLVIGGFFMIRKRRKATAA